MQAATWSEWGYRHYASGLLGSISWLAQQGNFDNVTDLAVTILAEPSILLQVGKDISLGDVSHHKFHLHGLNPLSVSSAQNIAILLLHGSGSNQGLWRSFAERLEKENIAPVFTVNTPKVGSFCHYEREVQEIEKQAVRERMEEIAELYTTSPTFILIGHSRGSDVAFEVCEGRADIGKVIRVAKPLSQTQYVQQYSPDSMYKFDLFEIEAEYDAICPWKSSAYNKSTVKAGHLSVLYTREAHNAIIRAIKPDRS